MSIFNLNKKILFFFLILCCRSQYASCQQDDYIATDSSISVGLKLIMGNSKENTRLIRQKQSNGGYTIYSPNEINEYGFKGGPTYISKNIIIESQEIRVFLEILEKGNVTLYRYLNGKKKKFFIEKDSSGLIELRKDKNNFEELFGNCEHSFDDIKLVSYSKKSLKKLVENYNNCNDKPFPYIKFGFTFSAIRTNLEIPKEEIRNQLAGITISPSRSFSFGVSIDLPIEKSDFSVNSGILFTKNGYTENFSTLQMNKDIVINLSSIQVPILLRYTTPINKLRPFLNIGTSFTLNTENSSNIYFSEIYDDVIIITRPIKEPLVSDYLIGYTTGAGFQYNLNYRKTVSAEIRYTRSFGKRETMNLAQLGLLISFSI